MFLSLLGALVMFFLYALIIGGPEADTITKTFAGVDSAKVHAFVNAWMFSGVVYIAAVTTPLGALSTFVDDTASGRLRDFLVSPLRRVQLILGYLGSAFLIGLVMTLIVFVIGLGYLWIASGIVLGPLQIVKAVGWIALSVAGFGALWAFVVAFLRSTVAFSAVTMIVATLTGFIAGAYFPVGYLPETVRNVISSLPFGHSAMLMRQEFADTALSDLGTGQSGIREALDPRYGMTLAIGDWSVPTWVAAGTLVALAVVCTALAMTRIRARIR
ncbi:MAG: ABC transporter permease [Frankiaceae bacterium]|nr:ABC transporter permease [Frankiaceae bacterium]